MMMQFQNQTNCFPALKFKQHSVWDDVSTILILLTYLALFVGCAYLLMFGLKLVISWLKKDLLNK